MKRLTFSLVLLAPRFLFAQTVDIETAYVNKCLAENKWTQVVATDNARLWKQIRGEYPVIPYDTTTGEVVVEHVITFAGVTQAQAFKRVKEWAALHFGSLAAVTDYEDAESGKIILEGWVPVLYESTFDNLWGKNKSVPMTRSLYFSLVVTVKDGKAKVGYKNMKYHYTIGGYVLGNVYMPVEWVRMPLGQAFPITAGDPGTWKGSIDLIRRTMSEVNATAPSLEKYIRDVVKDYGF